MAQNQALPSPSLPFVDPKTGVVNAVWFQFLNSIWQRTGGSSQQGNVQSVSATGRNGVIATVTNPTTTPDIIIGFDSAQLSLFTPTTGGIVPASGGGTGNFLRADGAWSAAPGTGTVTNVSVTTHTGVSGTVANPTTTPAISITLGAITPASVASAGAISGTTGTFTGTMEFGTFTNSTITNTGYITINDSGGTPRRLMVG